MKADLPAVSCQLPVSPALPDIKLSSPKVSSNHCFSDSSKGLLRVLRTSRRSEVWEDY